MQTLIEKPLRKPRSKPSAKEHDAALIAEVFGPDAKGGGWLDKHGMSAAELAGRVGCSDALISQWKGGKYTGDVDKIEGEIRAAMRIVESSGTLACKVVVTAAVRDVCTVAERVQRTGLCGVLWAGHGIGKSAAIAQFAVENPTALVLRVCRWSGSISGVEAAMMRFFSVKAWQKSGQKRGEWLSTELAGKQRMIIVDGADNLTPGARAWLFDLRAMTRCGLLFVCGPEGALFHEADARSRAEIALPVKMQVSADDARELARTVIGGEFPQLAGLAASLAGVILQHGIGRAVAVASLAADMVEHSASDLPVSERLESAARLCRVDLTPVQPLLK